MCYSTKKKSVRTLDDNDNYDERVFLGTLVRENYENENSKSESIFQLSENRGRVMTELQFTTKPYHKRTTPVVCRIDTGAELNVISKKDFECLFPERERKLEKPSCKITSYGGHGIANLGKCQLYAHHKGQVKEITFNITEVSGPAIIGCKTYKGSQVPIADALSRLSPQPAPPKGQLPQLSIHQVTDTLPASPAKLQQIRDLTTSDPKSTQRYNLQRMARVKKRMSQHALRLLEFQRRIDN